MEYIAAIGNGITILKRNTCELVHQFAGIRHIHGGFFLGDDVLAIFTGEQRLYFFQISEKKLLWECPRPQQLASLGDMKCCPIPGTDQIVCIAEGKQGINEHFLLLVDYKNRTCSLQPIPNCHRVVASVTWEQTLGVTLLSYEAKENGNLAYNIIKLGDSGALSTLCEWECSQRVNAYSGKHLFLNNNRGREAQLWMCELTFSAQHQRWKWSNAQSLPIPYFKTPGPVGAGVHLPYVSWVDEVSGLLTACTSDWIGVCDFRNCRMVAEYNGKSINCGMVLDGNLLVGSSNGVKRTYTRTSPAREGTSGVRDVSVRTDTPGWRWER